MGANEDREQRSGAEIGGEVELDGELRAIFPPAPAPPPELRARLVAMAEQEGAGADDLARGSRLRGPRFARSPRPAPRALAACLAAAALLFGARLAVQRAARGHAGARDAQTSGAGELSLEDEQFAVGAVDDDDGTEPPSLLELAAE